MIDKSTHFKQVCQLLLSLIVAGSFGWLPAPFWQPWLRHWLKGPFFPTSKGANKAFSPSSPSAAVENNKHPTYCLKNLMSRCVLSVFTPGNTWLFFFERLQNLWYQPWYLLQLILALIFRFGVIWVWKIGHKV